MNMPVNCIKNRLFSILIKVILETHLSTKLMLEEPIQYQFKGRILQRFRKTEPH